MYVHNCVCVWNVCVLYISQLFFYYCFVFETRWALPLWLPTCMCADECVYMHALTSPLSLPRCVRVLCISTSLLSLPLCVCIWVCVRISQCFPGGVLLLLSSVWMKILFIIDKTFSPSRLPSLSLSEPSCWPFWNVLLLKAHVALHSSFFHELHVCHQDL